MGKKVAGLLLADRSGSMYSCRASANKAINSFFKERSVAATDREYWALDQFDDNYEQVFDFTDIDAVPVYVMRPRGMTALHDSIAQAINKLANYKPDKNRLRILVIVTDGLENASKEHNAMTVKTMIDRKKADGWQVIYLGANQDAIKESAAFGVEADAALTYDTANSGAAMAAVSSYVTRGASGQGWSFTDGERKQSNASISDNDQNWTRMNGLKTSL